MIRDLTQQIPQDIFDYQQLIHAISDYAKPRTKIGQLIEQGVIIRIRKGLYTFSSAYRRHPLCQELIANLLYGPSYVSLEYALAYYGLIPERVSLITSVTIGRSRKYDTPIGHFSFQMIPTKAYQVGMTQISTAHHRYLVAEPEKALMDKIANTKGTAFRSIKSMITYLFEDLRIEETDLTSLKIDRLKTYAEHYGYTKCNLLVKAVEKVNL